MAYQVELVPTGIKFFSEEKESLLHAALRSGLNVDHGCTNGACGRCKARLLEGELSKIRHHDFVISEVDKLDGDILMCCHSACSKLKLVASLATGGSDIQSQEITTRIRRIEHVDANTMRLHLRTPRSSILRFMAGQHAILSLGANLQRELPIASCPCDGLNLEFHLHRDSSDIFTRSIYQRARKSMPVKVTAPCNGVVLEENDPSDILFIAWGVGFAPVQSLIEHCLSLDIQQRIVFHWVVHEHESHYADSYCRSTSDAIDNFYYHPIKTATAAEAINKIVTWHEDLSQWRSYIFAPPAIVENAIEVLCKKGLDEGKIKSDPIVA